MVDNQSQAELNAIISRYALHDQKQDAQRYSWLKPDVYLPSLLNAVPLLPTHVLWWIPKPSQSNRGYAGKGIADE